MILVDIDKNLYIISLYIVILFFSAIFLSLKRGKKFFLNFQNFHINNIFFCL